LREARDIWYLIGSLFTNVYAVYKKPTSVLHRKIEVKQSTMLNNSVRNTEEVTELITSGFIHDNFNVFLY